MLRLVRTKVASTVAEISTAEDYAWHKWLKIPDNEKVFFPQPSTARLLPKIPLKTFDAPDQRDYLFPILAPKYFSNLGTINFKSPVVSIFRFKIFKQLSKKFNFEFGDFFNEITDQSLHLKFLTFTQLFANTKIENSINKIYEFNLSLPEVYDKLNTLNASIIQIELLSEKENNFSKKIFSVKFNLNKKAQKYFKINPTILNGTTIRAIPAYLIPQNLKILKFLSPINMSLQKNYESITIESQKIFSSKFDMLDSCTVSDNDFQVYKDILQTQEIINEIPIENYFEKKAEEEVIPEIEVLVKSINKELLCGEFLSNKYSNIVNRLGNQREKSKINSILIICGLNEFQGIGERSLVNSPEGWVENLKALNFEKIRVVMNGSSFFNEISDCTSDVLITSYEILSNALTENLVNDDFCNFFDLMICDEFQLELEKHFSLIRKIYRCRNRFIWFTSTGSQEYLSKELQKVTSEDSNISISNYSIENVNRRKNQIKDQWLNLENLQRTEYEEALASAKKEMTMIVKEGNPFRFQSNIFTQIHKLKQACNFSSVNKSSSKANLLIQHIQIILASGRKVIVSSQYDNLGIKILEPVLKNHSISFRTSKNNLTDTDFENFMNSKTNALIFNGRLSKLKISGENLPSIILFDNWWNPINNWHLEDTFSNNLSGQIEIISYQIRNTIDETIQSKLMEKFLLDKNLFESLQADNYSRLLNEADWLEIIDVQNTFPASEESEVKIESWTLEYFISLINQFLRKLGFENLNIESGVNKNEFILKADYFSGVDKLTLNCIIFFSEFVTTDNIDKYLAGIWQINNTPNKIFIFCSGEIEFNKNAAEQISIIDGKKLRSYKKTFNLL